MEEGNRGEGGPLVLRRFKPLTTTTRPMTNHAAGGTANPRRFR
jgi:hypothetical protein